MSTLFTSARPLTVRESRPGVPWATAVTLGVVASSACAFWLMSLQGAIGSTERAETPTATSLMLAVVLLPVFCAFELGAMTLAMRWFGPVARGFREALPTALLLVAAGTLAGILVIVASSAYDYSLQVQHIGSGMAGMSTCTGACVAREQHEIFVLHVRGALLVGRWLLLTNAVLVIWLLTAWGGRITLGTRVADGVGPAARRTPVERDLADDVRLLLFGVLLGSAVIHAAVVPEHLAEWSAAGWFFVGLTVAELALAGMLLARVPAMALVPAVIAVSVVPLVAWLWSRTVGLPFGPEAGVAEAVGLADVLACALEAGALLVVAALLKRSRRGRPSVSPHRRALAGLALVAVTAIGFAATGPSWFDAFAVSAAQSMEMPR